MVKKFIALGCFIALPIFCSDKTPLIGPRGAHNASYATVGMIPPRAEKRSVNPEALVSKAAALRSPIKLASDERAGFGVALSPQGAGRSNWRDGMLEPKK